jgi:hypothetical protein
MASPTQRPLHPPGRGQNVRVIDPTHLYVDPPSYQRQQAPVNKPTNISVIGYSNLQRTVHQQSNEVIPTDLFSNAEQRVVTIYSRPQENPTDNRIPQCCMATGIVTTIFIASAFFCISVYLIAKH